MKGKIFNTQEVQAIIAGNKTMFREVIKPQPPLGCYLTINGNLSHALCFADCKTPRDERDYSKEPLVCVPPKATSIDHRLKCPYQVGQKIFCKESFVDFRNNNSDIFYKSDFEVNNLVKTAELKWKPAQHMKQEHSRLTLLIKEIKVERLADISEEGCWKEGLQNKDFTPEEFDKLTPFKIINRFADSWNATHKKPEEKWEANPWVWVIKVDKLEGQANAK